MAPDARARPPGTAGQSPGAGNLPTPGAPTATSSPPVRKTMYRWVDASGHVNYSDVPPPASANAKALHDNASVVETSGPGYATQRAMKSFPVVLFSAPGCSSTCENVRQQLAALKTPVTEVNVIDAASLDRLKKASGGSTVPVLTVGKDTINLSDPEALKAALLAAGYPVGGRADAARADQDQRP